MPPRRHPFIRSLPLVIPLVTAACLSDESDLDLDESALESVEDDLEIADDDADDDENEPETELPGLDGLDELMVPNSQDYQWMIASDVSAPGSTVVVPQTDPNNATWVLNAPNSVWGQLTTLSATIVHDGFLLGNFGWGHLAIATRGTSLEPSLQLLGLPSWLTSAFFWGEILSQAGTLPGDQLGPELNALIRGRGPTIWSKGQCTTIKKHPCIIFENYSRHHFPAKDVLVGPEIPLPIHSGPFQIWVEVDDYDMRVRVSQGGSVKVNASCLSLTGGDPRCGQQVGDGPLGDALFGFIMGSPLPSYAARRVGVQNPRVRVLQWHDWNPCPGCIEP